VFHALAVELKALIWGAAHSAYMRLKDRFCKEKYGKYDNVWMQVISEPHSISLDLRYKIQENQ
jgi:hypothetical protein